MKKNEAINDIKDELEGYNQWASLTLEPQGFDLTISSVKLISGKFYAGDAGDASGRNPMDIEVPASTFTSPGYVVTSGNITTIYGCGRSSAVWGFEAILGLYDKSNRYKIGEFYLSCPYNSTSQAKFMDLSDDTKAKYDITISGGNFGSGALGNITLALYLI